MTELRQKIYDAITAAKAPLTAKKVHDNYGDNPPDLSNIYRSLNYLESKGKINSLSYMGTKYFFKVKTCGGHFLICKECLEITAIDICAASMLEREIFSKYGFCIDSHIFYFEGYCSTCKKAIDKKNENR